MSTSINRLFSSALIDYRPTRIIFSASRSDNSESPRLEEIGGSSSTLDQRDSALDESTAKPLDISTPVNQFAVPEMAIPKNLFIQGNNTIRLPFVLDCLHRHVLIR